MRLRFIHILSVVGVAALCAGALFLRIESVDAGSRIHDYRLTDQITGLAADTVYASPELPAAEEFNTVGVHWEGDIADIQRVTLFVHTQSPSGEWSKPLPVHFSAGEGRDTPEENIHYSAPVNVVGRAVKYELIAPEEIREATFTFIVFDSRLESSRKFTLQNPFRAERADAARVRITSRRNWYADESLRYKSDSSVGWPESYVEPRMFIVHHTAGSDGGSNSKETVRAIYYYHAVTRGWYDIGYNYLIDKNGKIFEGRYGGESVVAGHTYNDITETEYNTGTIGVALIGCFEPYENSNACGTAHEVTPDMQNALEELIGEKAALHGIDTTAKITRDGERLRTVIGHKDVDSTLCPGDTTHDLLPEIRRNARTVIDSKLRARLVSKNFAPGMTLGGEQTAEFVFENTGELTWTRDMIRLSTYDQRGIAYSRLLHPDWDSPYGRFEMTEERVKPGETAHFRFKLHAANERGTFVHRYKLRTGSMRVKGSYQYELIGVH